MFTGVPDALLLVGIRLPQTADVCRHLPDELPIDAGDRDMRLFVDHDIDADWNVEYHRVGVAEREDHLLPFYFRAIADAHDVEFLLVSIDDAGDRVRDEAARQPVELSELWIVGRGLRHKVAVGHFELDGRRIRLPHLALRALHLDGAVDHFDGDPFGHGNWL